MKDIGKHSKNGKTISKDNFLPVKEHTEGPDRFKGRGLDGGPEHPHRYWYSGQK